MDIKIQSGKALPKIDNDKDASVVGTEAHVAVPDAAADPITNIATALVEGKIDSTQAVNRLIEETMNIEMVASAPDSLRKEVEAVLRSAIETDPYLVSLAQKME